LFVNRDEQGQAALTRISTSISILRVLLSSNPAITLLVHTQIQTNLDRFQKTQQWQHKSLALSLIHSLFMITTKTGALPSTINIQDIFSQHVASDLSASQDITRYEALVFATTFRSQLQCDPVFAAVCGMLGDSCQTVRLYASVCLDKLIGSKCVSDALVKQHADTMLGVIFNTLSAYTDVTAMTENQSYMRLCVRLLCVSADASVWMNHLIQVLQKICGGIDKKLCIFITGVCGFARFYHLVFEAVATIIKASPQKTQQVTELLFPSMPSSPLTNNQVLEAILSHPIPEYTPYTFQLLAQILFLHPTPPATYDRLLAPILAPQLWTSSVLPALTQLTCAYITRKPNTSTLEILSIVQKLIAKNEVQAMLILSCLFKYW
jgi:CAS/CSE protein, C-terminus